MNYPPVGYWSILECLGGLFGIARGRFASELR